MSLLSGLRVVESSAFVAAPLAGMTLAQMGADVIRIDPIGGGLDFQRWPVTSDGHSLYWAGLNKGKRSITLDLGSDEGRDLARNLIGASGVDAGLFLTNFPLRGWLAPSALESLRHDLIVVAVKGNRDGTSEVDYTVNAATSFPLITGDGRHPVNHVLPAWDCLTGAMAANGLLAAERYRRTTGRGQIVEVALSDVAFAMLATLGFVAEVEITGKERKPLGNDLYGTYGRDFGTRDGGRVMVVAVTVRQWLALVEATGIGVEVAAIEARHGIDLSDEGTRFEHRNEISALLDRWCRARSRDEIAAVFARHGVSWGPYQTVAEALRSDPRLAAGNGLFARVEHPALGALLTPGSPVAFGADLDAPIRGAPTLGEHTDEVLASVLGLDAHEIARLHDRQVVA